MRRSITMSLLSAAVVMTALWLVEGRAANDAPASHQPVVFSAMGCGPYVVEAAQALEHFIRQENVEPESEFLVHLGDIVSGGVSMLGGLPESVYENVARILTEGNRIPTYVLPGDNEWNDRPDHEAGWTYWLKHIHPINRRVDTSWKTHVQSIRPENFAFSHKGVLFVGINLVGGRIHDAEEWRQRHAQNVAWIDEQFRKSRKNVRATVVMCQARPNVRGPHRDFMEPFFRLAEAFGKPILFLHADGHRWEVGRPYPPKNIVRVQVDLIAPQFPPVQITVRAEGDAEDIFQFDRRLEAERWDPPATQQE